MGEPEPASAGPRRRPASRWLLTYRPHLYAGLQVVLQSLVNGGTLVVPEPDATPQAVAELMSTAEVAYASATPSYWRRLLLFAEREVLRRVPLRQITLGGEVADQPILDVLRQVFPSARIVHIYATTELGRCFAVTDGKTGFPARFLREPTPDGGELWLEDGELVARHAGLHRWLRPTPGEGGHRTGDLVEVVGDRAYFVGRRTDLINVGGNKVAPLEVERVIRRVPGVAEAKVHSRRSSIAGELVACQVVAADAATVEAAIVRACLTELAGFQRPRPIEFVPEIALDGSGKLNRRPES